MKKVKLHQLKSKEKDNALNEVRILASISDPYIIGYKEAFIDEPSSTLCIIMEYAGGGDLLHKINSHKKLCSYFSEETVWAYLIQMTKGLRTLHNMKILHRDLKCANVFLSTDESAAKLGDLNVSKVAKRGLVYTQTGTPYYASPEVWRDEPYDGKSDIWSLGCVLYEVVTLKPPFRANDMDGLYRKVQKGLFDRIPSRYSADLASVISSCLSVRPSSRPSCDQLLNHPAVIRRNPSSQPAASSVHQANKTGQGHELLSTIKMPRNLKSLGDILPKPKYEARVNQSFELRSNSRGREARNSLQDLRAIAEARRPSSSASRRVSTAASKSPNRNPQVRRQPVRGMSLDPDHLRPKPSPAVQPVVRSNSRNYQHLHPDPTIRRVNSNANPSQSRVRSNSKGSSPYQRAANNILKQHSSHATPSLHHKPPTPGQHIRSRDGKPNSNQNANPFVDQERKHHLISKITSNNVLRSIDMNSRNPQQARDQQRYRPASGKSPSRHVSQNVLGENRYYMPQSNVNKIDSMLAAQSRAGGRRSKLGNYHSISYDEPQGLVKPIWMN